MDHAHPSLADDGTEREDFVQTAAAPAASRAWPFACRQRDARVGPIDREPLQPLRALPSELSKPSGELGASFHAKLERLDLSGLEVASQETAERLLVGKGPIFDGGLQRRPYSTNAGSQNRAGEVRSPRVLGQTAHLALTGRGRGVILRPCGRTERFNR